MRNSELRSSKEARRCESPRKLAEVTVQRENLAGIVYFPPATQPLNAPITAENHSLSQ
jgi:hypothetical protein